MSHPQNREELVFLTQLVKLRTGIALGEDKYYLLDARLSPIARQHGLDGLNGLIRRLMTMGSAENLATRQSDLLKMLDEAIATHETLFFRDMKPFNEFRTIHLPALLEQKNDKTRIWCAAASSGQEPYTLAMLLREHPTACSMLQPEILATDLSKTILDKAKEGCYSQFEVQRGLPVQYLVKYFEQQENNWQIKPILRDMIRFETHNLLASSQNFGMFDLIYCRNVLIYFDVPTKKAVVDRLAKQLKPGGRLIIGSAESLIGVTDSVKIIPGLSGTYGAPTP